MTRSLKYATPRVAAALLMTAQLWCQSPSPAITDIVFCDFRVPEFLVQGNASFRMTFHLEVGKNQEPTDIRVVGDHLLDEKSFIDCLRTWRLPAPIGEKVRVEFDWVHAQGWVALRIMGATFSQRLKVAPGMCVPAGR
jgi:hypothetical protein